MPVLHRSRLPRVPFSRPIRLESGSRATHTVAFNLSLGGMFLEAEQPPPVGERVSISLDNGDQALTLGDAEIVWRVSSSNPGFRAPRRFGCGVRFVSLRPTGKSIIETIVRHGGTSSLHAPVLSSEAPTQPDGKL